MSLHYLNQFFGYFQVHVLLFRLVRSNVYWKFSMWYLHCWCRWCTILAHLIERRWLHQGAGWSRTVCLLSFWSVASFGTMWSWSDILMCCAADFVNVKDFVFERTHLRCNQMWKDSADRTPCWCHRYSLLSKLCHHSTPSHHKGLDSLSGALSYWNQTCWIQLPSTVSQSCTVSNPKYVLWLTWAAVTHISSTFPIFFSFTSNTV